MKINKVQNHAVQNQPNKEKEKKPEYKESLSPSGVKVEISSSAKELVHRIREVEGAEFSEKVEKIRSAYIGGTYRVNPEEIAEKILEAIEKEKGDVK